MRAIRIAIAVAAVVAIVCIGIFLYLTRGIASPSQPIAASVEQIEASDTSSQVIFRIAQDESVAAYSIFEVLDGSDKTVVGTTNQVAGDILIDLSDPSQSEIGEVAVNARTFGTDDDRRDNSVARFILQSEDDANEFITFAAASISGLPSNIGVGDTVTFEVMGSLTIAGVTNQVIFDVSATLESADTLVGHAETVIRRSDYNLTIPNLPFVADVGEDVSLTLDFVAHAVTVTTA